MIWTPDAIALLKRRLRAGHSFGLIAAALGVSRSSVAGKCQRLRLKGKPSDRPHKTLFNSPRRMPKKRPARISGDEPIMVKPPAPPAPPPPPPLEGRLGAADAVAALSVYQCAWPHGDPVADDDFHFCARPVDPHAASRYCPEHQRLAAVRHHAPHHPPPPRRLWP